MDVEILATGRFLTTKSFDSEFVEGVPLQTPEMVTNSRVVLIPTESPDDRIVAVSGRDDPFPLFVYDLPNRSPLTTCVGHKDLVFSLVGISDPCGGHSKILSGGCGDGKLLVFDAVSGKQLSSLPFESTQTTGIVHVAEWHEEAYVTGTDPTCFVQFDLNREIVSAKMDGLQAWAEGIDASVSRNVVFTASSAGWGRLWARETLRCEKRLKLADKAFSCCYAEDKDLLLVGLSDGDIEMWDLRMPDHNLALMKQPVPIPSSTMYCIDRLDENTYVSACWKGYLNRWDSVSAECCEKRVTLSGAAYGICVCGADVPFLRHKQLALDEERERVQFLLEEDHLLVCIVVSGIGVEIRFPIFLW